MSDKRVDPATGEAVTYNELVTTYKKTYKRREIEEYWEACKPARAKKSKAAPAKESKPSAKAKSKPDPKAKAKDGKKDEKAKPKAKAAPTKPETKTDDKVRTGKDGGASALAKLRSFSGCVLAEYVWLDADGVTRSKTMTMTARPLKVTDLKVWNYDGSSTGQADGHNSEVLLKPRAIFNDPFRGYPNVMVLADAWNAWDDQPAKNNTRAPCAEIMDMYRSLDPWFGIEQEYTLMKPGKVGLKPTVPLGFNADGSEPAPQGPYYTGAGFNVAIGRPVADEHYKLCMEAGVKISGINAEVMPGQWEFQIGPCRGIEMGDHLTMARYIMLRVTEKHDCVCSFEPKPAKGDWNGAGCHTNFSVTPMRVAGGYDTIIKVCEAFGKVAKEHIAEYGEDNDKRLTGKHETCDINTFKYGVANRGASIRIPREAEKSGRGYMEDRRPGANCDPYRVTKIIMKTTGECLSAETIEAGGKTHTAFVFIKPHANNEKVQTLVKEKLTSEGLTIKSEGTIKSTVIDKKKLIDTHYGAIAAKAVTMKPKDLTVQEKSQEEFEKQFGVKWSKVMEDGLVFNAMDGAKKLGITADELGKKYDALKKGEGIIKFGGGFYCGKVDDIYVINGFYMNMRSKFTAPGTSIYYYEVEWPVEKMPWADFRGKLLGPTDPASAPEGSLRQQIYSKWSDLGLKAQPDTGDNGVHASASPFEALAERCNWLRASISKDAFGKGLLASGIPLPILTKEWFNDPQVDFEGGKKSLFDLLEDLDAAACLKKCKEIVRLEGGSGEFAFKEANLQLLLAGASCPDGGGVVEGLDELLAQVGGESGAAVSARFLPSTDLRLDPAFTWITRISIVLAGLFPNLMEHLDFLGLDMLLMAFGKDLPLSRRPARRSGPSAMTSPGLASPRSPRSPRSPSPRAPPEVKPLFSASSDHRCLSRAAADAGGEACDERQLLLIKTRVASHRLSQCKAKLGSCAARLDHLQRQKRPRRQDLLEASRLLLEVVFLLTEADRERRGRGDRSDARTRTPSPRRPCSPHFGTPELASSAERVAGRRTCR
ncbi:unnamed protein product [Durusdinium trenchii]|uniref:Glutamine synthetase n=1 Tax=Durusdinium trenchii TaxID=1381693 RepID=A0ABP0QH91_9DINO